MGEHIDVGHHSRLGTQQVFILNLCSGDEKSVPHSSGNHGEKSRELNKNLFFLATRQTQGYIRTSFFQSRQEGIWRCYKNEYLDSLVWNILIFLVTAQANLPYFSLNCLHCIYEHILITQHHRLPVCSKKTITLLGTGLSWLLLQLFARCYHD